MDDQLKQSALDFHEFPVPGKIQVSPTKPLATQRDLALAYSPGVAAPCLEIEKDPLAAYKYTARGNLVAVISNGTAVLGLGNIGALAGKPVMEGKGVLFKKFAGIDVFDIEVDELDPDKFINVVAALEPTFGGINLEDIKAPECFYIEQKLRERMNIPVFHDDQHGTAIISTAAILNGLRVVEKNLSDVRMVVSGAGAAAIACMNLLVALGMQNARLFPFRQNYALRRFASLGENRLHKQVGFVNELSQLVDVDVEISNRTRRHARLHRRFRHRRSDLNDQARIKRFWNDVFRTKAQILIAIR